MISNAMIQKWIKMLRHDSVLHVEQSEGKHYSASEIAGYYNNFSGKIESTKNFDAVGIPQNIASHGNEKEKVYFPIAIFQYGLGAYDLWLETKKRDYYNTFLAMADWAVCNQEESGAWNTFGVLRYNNPYSSMAQGEGSSLLARAYKETKSQKYYVACTKAVDFMLLPVTEGGTSECTSTGVVLKEYPDKAPVLNGWIFSAFGLFDAWKLTGKQKYSDAWKKTSDEIKNNLCKFDAGHWSYYDMGGKLTSPFYHSLHIELLKALNRLSPALEYEEYINKWDAEKNSWIWNRVAFVRKAMQKITEKQTQEWVMVS